MSSKRKNNRETELKTELATVPSHIRTQARDLMRNSNGDVSDLISYIESLDNKYSKIFLRFFNHHLTEHNNKKIRE